MILDCRLMLLISNNIIHCAEILSVCLSADDLMSATKLYVRFSWNSVCYKIAGIRWSLWKRTLLRGVNEFISWSKWVKFDCISLLVKSLKDCKFFEKKQTQYKLYIWKYRNYVLSAFHTDLVWFVQNSAHKQIVWATYFREGSNCLLWGVNKLLPLFSHLFSNCAY